MGQQFRQPNSAGTQDLSLRNRGRLFVLAIQCLDGTDGYFSVVPVENIMMIFRGSAIQQGLVFHPSVRKPPWKANALYVRTTSCQLFPAGIYQAFHHSLEALNAILPPEMFCWASQSCLINHRRLVGRQVMEKRGRRRMVELHDDKSSPGHVVITKNHIQEVLRLLGIPSRRQKTDVVATLRSR